MAQSDSVTDQESEDFEKKLAELLSISYEELLTTEYEVTDYIGEDQVIFQHVVRFSEDSPRSVLDKIPGLGPDNEITIPIVDLADEE